MRSEQAARRGAPHPERPAKEARHEQGREGGKGAGQKGWRAKGTGRDKGQQRKQDEDGRRGNHEKQTEKHGGQGGGARARR